MGNLEFNQFHPTCLYHPQAKNFLITEALRGEGAHLKLPNGERFMARFDERLELAPRDIVARAIDHEMKRLGIDCVYLDISHKPAASLSKSISLTVYERCLTFGIDITQQPIPVVPRGPITPAVVWLLINMAVLILLIYMPLAKPFWTGLHGANRMASNSLLRSVSSYARSAAADISRSSRPCRTPRSTPALGCKLGH